MRPRKFAAGADWCSSTPGSSTAARAWSANAYRHTAGSKGRRASGRAITRCSSFALGCHRGARCRRRCRLLRRRLPRAGATLGDPWDCELVVKVKELQESSTASRVRGQTVFGFQHFGPDPELLDAALASGATFVAFETVGQQSGLPILSPMSAIAGRLAVQVGAWCLQKQNGGSGVLLPGLDEFRRENRHRRCRQRRRQRAACRARHRRRVTTVFSPPKPAIQGALPQCGVPHRRARHRRMPTSSSPACSRPARCRPS